MSTIKTKFLALLKKYDINIITLVETKSAFAYAIKILNSDIGEGNNIEHSLRVFNNCFDLINNLEFKVTKNEILILFYSSLLHDIAKTRNVSIKKELESILSSKCPNYKDESTDHGIRSAFYVKAKLEKKDIKFIGLTKNDIPNIYQIISFHTSARFQSSFLPSSEISKRLLELALIFWLADTADGTHFRSDVASTTDPIFQDEKTRARSGIKKVSIKKDRIIWHVEKESKELRQAIKMENDNLSKHFLLLKCLNLPSSVELYIESKGITDKDSISHENINVFHLAEHNLCIDTSSHNKPLVLSAKSIDKLYENIVEAFNGISVNQNLASNHYFGPTILEIKDITNDNAEKVILRCKHVADIKSIKEYTKLWLNPSEGIEKNFYFGYTHGQRIYEYKHPLFTDAYKVDGKKGEDAFKEWSGKIDQFANVVDLFKDEGKDARRCYVMIAHPILDNPRSKLRKMEEMSPAMLAIQFVIESESKLSAFALLRAQELSTFSLVNYFELKELIDKILLKIKDKIIDIKPGRIVMLSSLSYFDTNTVLLDKPKICKTASSQIEHFCLNLGNENIKQEFIEMLKDFTDNSYLKIESEWCSPIVKSCSNNNGLKKVKQCAIEAQKALSKLECERLKHNVASTSPNFRDGKRHAMAELIKSITEF